MPKWKGKLISGQGEQVAKFTHQGSFCQALGSKRDGGLTACWLANEAALIGIEAQFEYLVAQAGAQIVVIASKVEPPVDPDAAKLATGGQVRKDARQVEHPGFPFGSIESTRVQGLRIGLYGSLTLQHAAGNRLTRAWRDACPAPSTGPFDPASAGRAALAGSWFGACVQSWRDRWGSACS